MKKVLAPFREIRELDLNSISVIDEMSAQGYRKLNWRSLHRNPIPRKCGKDMPEFSSKSNLRCPSSAPTLTDVILSEAVFQAERSISVSTGFALQPKYAASGVRVVNV